MRKLAIEETTEHDGNIIMQPIFHLFYFHLLRLHLPGDVSEPRVALFQHTA